MENDEDVWCSDAWLEKQISWYKRKSPRTKSGNKPLETSPRKTPSKDVINLCEDAATLTENVVQLSDDVVNLSDSIEISTDSDTEIEEDIKVSFIEESRQIHRFFMLPSQHFKTIFEQIAKFKDVPVSQVKLTMQPIDRVVSQFDTFKSLNYEVTNYFYAYIDSNLKVNEGNGTGNIEIICVAPDKMKLKYRMDEHHPFDIIMSLCSRDLKRDKNQFKLIFDGEIIKPSDTCTTLDIGDQDLIEIHF